MEVTNELIAKFFRQECTPGERQLVSDYFELHPDELDKYIGEDDWQKLEPEAELHPAVSEIMLQHIESQINGQPGISIKKYRVWIAAASVIFIAGISLFFALRETNAKQHNNGGQPVLTAATARINDTVRNKTAKELAIALPDGSEVLLSANSQLVYYRAFNQKHRDILLTGEAVFKVAKDKTRPFTVYASGLSTTALGTCFRVSAFNSNADVSVKLYEGKVVVKHTQLAKGAADSDIYLTPGHELRWNSNAKKSRVIAFDNNVLPGISPLQTNGIKLPVSFVKFNNERLASVLNQLQAMYNIRIRVPNGGLENKFFTGTVNSRKETADDILNTIAMLNKFSVKKQADTYTLSPQANVPADSTVRSKRNE